MQASGHPHLQAVAAALSNARRHPHQSSGGIVGYQTGGAPQQQPGLLPSSQNQNPLAQGMIQQFSQLPTEKLQELASSGGAGPQAGLLRQILQMRHMQPGSGPQGAPSQIPPSAPMPGSMPPTMQSGGPADWTESEKLAHSVSRGTTGFIHSPIPGRTDLINAQPPVGSYVLPADVVSGVGEGNSLAGAALMQRAMTIGPFGVPIQSSGHGGMRMPAPPPRFTKPIMGPTAARGGRTEREGQPTPILAAGGEMIIPPEIVRAWGGGNLKRGHDVLDHWVVAKRKKIAHEMLKLAPPKKS